MEIAVRADSLETEIQMSAHVEYLLFSGTGSTNTEASEKQQRQRKR